MASFRILFKRSAEKELRGISHPTLQKILEKIDKLQENPRPPEAKMLKGEARYFRLRQGDYRIMYEVDDSSRIVTMIKIGHRREVYD